MLASISSRVNAGSIAISVSGSIDPSRCKCNSALSIAFIASPCHNSCAMTPNEVEAILGGYHGDPFRFLGPHETETGWEIRAFLPQALAADLETGGVRRPMTKTQSQGLFLARTPGDPGAYRIRLHLWDGAETTIDDPYRFPPLLSDFDLHLHGEGTQYESYRTMGAHPAECEG